MINHSSKRLLALVHHASCAARHLRRRLGELAAAAQLSDGELLVVWLCSDGDGLVQGDLATAIGVSPAQMSGIVERLRQRGLIAMERSPLDRRRQVWRSTPVGRELFSSLQPQLGSLGEQLDALVPAADQEAALALCRQLAAAAERMSASSSSLPLQEAA